MYILPSTYGVTLRYTALRVIEYCWDSNIYEVILCACKVGLVSKQNCV
jgi:hypothetical protein